LHVAKTEHVLFVARSRHRMLHYRKQRKSRLPLTQRKAKPCAASCQKVANILTAGHELSTLLELKPTTGHTPQPVPPTSYPNNILP